MTSISNSVATILKHPLISSKLLDAADFVGLTAAKAAEGFEVKFQSLLLIQMEKAYYYYKDVLYRADPTLPISLLTGSNGMHLFSIAFFSTLCPTLSVEELDTRLSVYADAKNSADSCGVIIVKSSFTEVLMVQEWNKAWNFPKGTREAEVVATPPLDILLTNP